MGLQRAGHDWSNKLNWTTWFACTLQFVKHLYCSLTFRSVPICTQLSIIFTSTSSMWHLLVFNWIYFIIPCMYFSVLSFTSLNKPRWSFYSLSLIISLSKVPVSLFLSPNHCKQVYFCFTSSSSFCLEFSSGVNVHSSRVNLYLHLPGTTGNYHYGGSLTKFSGWSFSQNI